MRRLVTATALALLLVAAAPSAYAYDADQFEFRLRVLEQRIFEIQSEIGADGYMTHEQYALLLSAYYFLWQELEPLYAARKYLMDHRPPGDAPAIAHKDWRKQFARYDNEIRFAEARLNQIAANLNLHRPAGAPFAATRAMLTPPALMGLTGFSAMPWAFTMRFGIMPGIRGLEVAGVVFGFSRR